MNRNTALTVLSVIGIVAGVVLGNVVVVGISLLLGFIALG